MRRAHRERTPGLPAVLVLVLGLVLGIACGGAPVDATDARSATACSPKDLASCEAAIGRALELGDPVAPLTHAYAEARRSADEEDGFAATLAAAEDAKKRGPVALGVEPKATAPKTDLPRFEAKPFRAVGSARPELLVLAIAETAGLDELALALEDGRVVRAFGADPLLPLVAGLPATMHGSGELTLATDGALEHALRGAVAAARASDYVAASHAVDALDALVDARPRWDEATVRARVLLAALDLSEPRPLFGADAPAPPPAPAPRDDETAYVDLLRVRVDPASAHAYDARRGRLVKALPPELVTPMDVLYGTPVDACALGLPPAFTRARDLTFLGLLPRALRTARTRDPAGRLALEAWYPIYGAATALVEKTHTGWLFAPTLLLERGAASNVVPTGTDTHRRVTELALGHEKALTKLAEERPGRVGLSRLAFLVARGHYDDAPLRSAALDLARLIAQGTLANAESATDVLAATFVGAFYGLSLPGELQETHFTALQGAFTARLRGDLSTQTGWGVATAFALDGAYRALFDLAPSPKRTVTEITRALEGDPSIAEPGLAGLVASLVRYGSIASDGQLGTPILTASDTPLPGRAEARTALRRALTKLSAGAEPSKEALDDLTSLVDGGAATLALATLAPVDTAPNPAPPKPSRASGPACKSGELVAVDPRVRRAVGKLADLRRRVWSSTALADGSVFGKRARLAVLLISDAVDVAQARAEAASKPKKSSVGGSPLDELPRTRFFISQTDADAVVAAALSTYGAEGDGARAIASAYSLARGFFREGRDHLAGSGKKAARALLEASAGLLDDGSGALGASELLRALGRSIGDATDASASPVFVAVARELYGRDQGIEADMVLLSAAAVAAVTSSGVPAEAIELAASKKSDVAAALAFLRESERVFSDGKFDPASFTPGLDGLAKRRCVGASAAGAVEAYQAIAKWKSGDHEAGRLALDAWLDRAPTEVSIPRYSFQFKQETRTRAVSLTLEIGAGRGLLQGTNSLNAGAAAKSPGEPLLALDVGVDSPDSKRTRDDTARFYVHAAATAAVYHFLSGDDERAEVAAMRAIAATTHRTELYVMGVSDEPPTFAKDAAPTLAVAARLAADHGRPLLAGALWGIVRSTAAPDATADDLAEIGELAAPGIDKTPGIEPIEKRATASLRDLASGLPCAGPKLDQARFMTTNCQGYPEAVGLRVADAVAGLPRLKPGPRGEAAACPDLAALDAFLGPMQSARYEPDRLVAATRTLLDAGKTFEATVLLSQQRDPAHCSRDVVALLHEAASRTKGVPAIRADLLGAAVNCGKGSISAELLADLEGFAAEISRLGDPIRELELSLFAAELTLSSNDVRPIALVARRDGYLQKGRDAGPLLLGIALVLDHAASALAHEPVHVAATEVDYELLCGTMPRDDRAPLCALVSSLRKDVGDPETRAKTARTALEKMMTIPK